MWKSRGRKKSRMSSKKLEELGGAMDYHWEDEDKNGFLEGKSGRSSGK